MKQFIFWMQDFILDALTFDFFIRKRIIKRYTKGFNFRKVLDAGCGTGTLAQMFSKAKYYGVDINQDLVLYARGRYKGYNFQVADITNFKSDNKFDLVVIVGVLHHLSDSEVDSFLKSLSTCLARNSKIIIIEAIYPLNKLNFIGFLLRYFDQGNYIRKSERYRELIEKKFIVTDNILESEVFFDYTVFCAKT